MQRRIWSGIFEFALKHRLRQAWGPLLDIFIAAAQKIGKTQHGKNYAVLVLQYVLLNTEASELELFEQKLQEYLSPEIREEVMTLAQRFEQRGIQKGMQQGMQQGKQEEAKIFMRNLLKRGHAIEDIAQIAELSVEEVKKLLKNLGD